MKLQRLDSLDGKEAESIIIILEKGLSGGRFVKCELLVG